MHSLGYETLVALEVIEKSVGDGVHGNLHFHSHGHIQPRKLLIYSG
jgi:hypothetical protein